MNKLVLVAFALVAGSGAAVADTAVMTFDSDDIASESGAGKRPAVACAELGFEVHRDGGPVKKGYLRCRKAIGAALPGLTRALVRYSDVPLSVEVTGRNPETGVPTVVYRLDIAHARVENIRLEHVDGATHEVVYVSWAGMELTYVPRADAAAIE